MTDLTLFTNRNTRRDFVVNAIDSLSARPCRIGACTKIRTALEPTIGLAARTPKA